jgi:3'(2'), 5'-bisphosphate nucleotidase
VLEAAGGRVVDLAGAALRYVKPGFENPDFIAWGAADAPGGKPRARAPRGGS